MNSNGIQTAPLGPSLEPLDALRTSETSSPRGAPSAADSPALALPHNAPHRSHRMSLQQPLPHEADSFPSNASMATSALSFHESQIKLTDSVQKVEADVTSMSQDLVYFRHVLDFQNSKIEKLTQLLLDLLHNKDVAAIVASLSEIQTSDPFGVDDPDNVNDSLSDSVHDPVGVSLQTQGVLGGDMDRQIHQVAQAAVSAQAKPEKKGRKRRYKEKPLLSGALSGSLGLSASESGSLLSNHQHANHQSQNLQSQNLQSQNLQSQNLQSQNLQSHQNQSHHNQSHQTQNLQTQNLQTQNLQPQNIQPQNIQNQRQSRQNHQSRGHQSQNLQNHQRHQNQSHQGHPNHQNSQMRNTSPLINQSANQSATQSPAPISRHHMHHHEPSPPILDSQLRPQQMADELHHTSSAPAAPAKPGSEQDLSQDEKDMGVVSMPGLEVVNINDISGRKRPKVEIDFLHNPMTVKEIYDEFTKGFRGQPPLREMDERFGKHQWRGDSRSKESKRFQRRKKLCNAIERGMEKYGKSQEEIMNYIEEFRGEKSLTWVMNGHLPADLLE